MRKCALLVLFAFLPICGFSQQTPFSTVGNLVLNGLFLNNVSPAVPHSYKIATLPANNAVGHDFLRILVTLNPNFQGNKDSYIDATFANRGGFTYQYMLLGAPVTTTTTLAAYQNADSSVDIYIVFSGASQYTIAGYTMLQNLQETAYATPSDANANGGTVPGTLVFDASSSQYPPTIAFDQSSQILSAADSATVPTYTWSGDTNTGMFSPAADSIGISTAGVERMRVDSSGRVGIGTTVPIDNLQVSGGVLSGSAGQTVVEQKGDGVFLASSIDSQHYRSVQLVPNNNVGYVGLSINGIDIAPLTGLPSSGAITSTLAYFNGYNGNVGIGTTNPQAKLEVNGGLRFTGDASGTVQTTAWTGVLCGGDYAEAVDPADKKDSYKPGDVLIITGTDKGDIQKSSEPYSTMVAGVFATKPGVVGRRQTMPNTGEEIPMAMVGIVPTKVTAENGPIRRGDLLVSSSQPGYAMKGTDRNRMLGAVIGKAMGSLDSGSGIIEVLVTLQ